MATAQTSNQPQKIYLKDYQSPDYSIESVDLYFDLHEDHCLVTNTMKMNRIKSNAAPLVLNGEAIELISVEINSRKLATSEYSLTAETLSIPGLPESFTIKTVVKNKPQENTALEGLYKSKGIFCTQCEAQGFRRITYFLDRPDVMTKYTVTLEADQAKYPVLLANGDRIETQQLSGGRHQVKWQDPFKKPCYLFAIVGGDLGVIKDTFITMSGKKVGLEIYAPHESQDRCHHAMDSLKKSMKWDEERFGREYDLSTYMIVAIDDFNMGAMENKGLNIFNSRLVLADPKSATDDDYFNIEAVVAHEYFHNWTGNRVTVRDWFHLSLKEGLTVFRDQEFSMDMSSRAMVRIDNVNDLRSRQFAEDAGPNAHPIRPDSCYAVDNFYTSTIYEKGAEVIRMMQTMVGRPGFRKGMDLYFERHDGQAVIIEDFARAISDANGQNWDQFKLWYSQAGTPHVKVEESYDGGQKKYRITLTQSSLPSPGQPEKKPFHLPLVVGLLDSVTGQELKINHPDVTQNTEGQNIIHLKAPQMTLEFTNLSNRPVLSLNRQFSSPIHMDWAATDQDLLFLLENDTDSFNRWEASQKLSLQNMKAMIQAAGKNETLTVNQPLLAVMGKVLDNSKLDPDLKAALLTLPEDSYILQLEKLLHATSFYLARDTFEKAICTALEPKLLETYQLYHGKNNQSRDPKDFAKRRLKNLCLSYLSQNSKYHDLIYKQFQSAEIMTDQLSGMSILSHLNSDYRKLSLDQFYSQWKNDFLVMNKWFAIQATSTHPDTFETVQKLWTHPLFDKKNPNRVYALLGGFGRNLVSFHDPKKDTYSFMADRIIELDKLNPTVATRVAESFSVWTRLPVEQKNQAHRQLERILASGLSKNTYEIVSKQLAAN
ncbi:MAG: aminopeptidase N [Oligoflexia bacterium]|nr:MAG: aminopeptidase N [Oligoflexia bacterium]